jgi:3-oxoacyl-[acyl-carrier protein] reductase
MRAGVTVRLQAKTVIITGAGQGIGRALALRLGAEGAHVAVTDVNEESARRVASEIEAAGGRAHALTLDVVDRSAVTRVVAEVAEQFGGLDILVNNAGIFSTIRMGPFEEISEQEFSQVMAVNVAGTFNCCQAVAPLLRAQHSGSIINLSSGTVRMGRPFYAHYVTSKAAVVGMTRALANELGDDNIRVNAIMPGSIKTEIPRDTVTPEQARGIIARQALKRQMTPEDILGTIVFLASDDSEMLTGQVIVVDGGVIFS